MGVAKTQEKFEEEMKKLHPNIIIMSDYINNEEKVLCKCLIDNYEWFSTPRNLKLHGCKKCSVIKQKLSITKPHNTFIKEMVLINPNIEILSEYKHSHSKIKCKCKIDNYEWETTPTSLLMEKGCPVCNKHYFRTNDEFIKDIKILHPDIELLTEYINQSKKVKCRCNKDGCEWLTTPNNLLRSHGCPTCSQSSGEKRISKYLKSNNILYNAQKEYEGLVGLGNGLLSYDFYLLDYNLLIEYQGGFHDGSGGSYRIQTKEDLKNQQEHDKRKRDFAKDNNIKLLEIWYWDFNNIEKILKLELNQNNKIKKDDIKNGK